MDDKARQLAEALKRYGEGSAASLDKMRSDIQGAVAAAPPWLDEAAGHVSRLLPGVGVLDSMRLASDSGGHFREGRYGSGLEAAGQAMLAPVNEAFWFVPGGGIVKKVAR
jgi:hypothetical protein